MKRKKSCFGLPVILLLLLLTGFVSCKTCDCPAYTSLPGGAVPHEVGTPPRG